MDTSSTPLRAAAGGPPVVGASSTGAGGGRGAGTSHELESGESRKGGGRGSAATGVALARGPRDAGNEAGPVAANQGLARRCGARVGAVVALVLVLITWVGQAEVIVVLQSADAAEIGGSGSGGSGDGVSGGSSAAGAGGDYSKPVFINYFVKSYFALALVPWLVMRISRSNGDGIKTPILPPDRDWRGFLTVSAAVAFFFTTLGISW